MLFYILCALAAVLAGAVCALTGAFAGLAWLWLLPVLAAAFLLGLLLLAFGFLALACALVDQDKPQERDSGFYRCLAHVYIDAVIRAIGLRLVTDGLEQLPAEGRFLLVCNHQHDIDPALLLHVFPRRGLTFISKRENRTMPIVGRVMHKLRCPLLNRENDREALKTILQAVRLLQEDQASVAVFPEGYVSKDCKLHRFRGGVFKIAQRAQVPIVVCTLRDTRAVVPNLLHLRRSRVELHLVGVIPAGELAGRRAMDIADQVYSMMLADLGPEYIPPQPEN